MKDFYWYWLCNIPGIGTMKRKHLLEWFHVPENIYKADYKELKQCNTLTDANIEALVAARENKEIYKSFVQLKEKNVCFFHIGSQEYPESLYQLYDYPIGLYGKGSFPKAEEPVVAVVGARSCSEYGKTLAWKFSEVFAQMGICVVSGMARGIDTAAHQGCLAGGGRTYAVLGCGVDICYPRENIELYMEIQKHGGVMSEYALGTPPAAGQFPVRNRIISGIADAVIVVEARKRSGSFITVDQALEQNKDVFVMPGRIGDALSEGCNHLMKQGAQIMTEPEDILQSSAIMRKISARKTVKKYFSNEKSQKNGLATEKDMVYSCLNLYPKSLDIIIEETGLDIAVVNRSILDMQLEGLVKEISKNCYVRNDLWI